MGIDRDHLLWTEPHWTSSKEARQLRTKRSLIAPLDRETHELKHKETPPVPLLGYYALVRTLKFYEDGRTPLESIDNLQHAIEQASNHPKAHEIEKHLAELAIWTLDLAKPYWALSPDQPSATVIDMASYRGRNNGTTL